MMLTTSPVTVPAERSGLGTQCIKYPSSQYLNSTGKFGGIPDTSLLINDPQNSKNSQASPPTINSSLTLFENAPFSCDEINYRSPGFFIAQNQETHSDSHISKVEKETPTTNDGLNTSVEVETLNINISKDVPLTFGKNNKKQHRSSIHIQANNDPIQYITKETSQILKDKLIEVHNQTPQTDFKSNANTLSPATDDNDSWFKNQTLLTDKFPTEGNKPNEERVSNTLYKNPEVNLTQENKLDITAVPNSNKVNISPKTANKSIISNTKPSPQVSDIKVSAVSQGNAELEELEATVERILSEVAVQESLLNPKDMYEYHAELKNEIQEVPQVEKHVNILNVLPNEETVIELLPRQNRNKRGIEKKDETNHEKLEANEKKIQSHDKSSSSLISRSVQLESGSLIPRYPFKEKPNEPENKVNVHLLKYFDQSCEAGQTTKQAEAKEENDNTTKSNDNNIIKGYTEDPCNTLSSPIVKRKIIDNKNKEQLAYDPPSNSYVDMQYVTPEQPKSVNRYEILDISKPKKKQEIDINTYESVNNSIQKAKCVSLKELQYDPFAPSKHHIAEQEVSDDINETRIPSNIAATPRSVKHKSALKHKPEKRDDSVYDYKWPDNWPDEDPNNIPDDLVMLMSDDEMNEDFKDNWSSVWSINPPDPNSEDLSKTSSNVALKFFAKNLLFTEGKVQTNDFDDDIETNIFEEDNPQHSIRELEETMNQLVSEVEMDETQLLKHLSSLDNIPTLQEKFTLPSSTMEPEKLTNEAALHESSTKSPSPNAKNVGNNKRAEVKLLIATKESGKKAIEVHSIDENVESTVGVKNKNVPFTTDSKSLHLNQPLKDVNELLSSSQTLSKVDILHTKDSSSIQSQFEVYSENSFCNTPTIISDNLQIENEDTGFIENRPELEDSKQMEKSIFPENSQFQIQRLLVRTHGNEPETKITPKQSKSRRRKSNKSKLPKTQTQNSENEKQQAIITYTNAEYNTDQPNSCENNLTQSKCQTPQNSKEIFLTEKLTPVETKLEEEQVQNSNMNIASQHELKFQEDNQEKVTGMHPKRRHRKHKKKSKQQECKEETEQSQQIQRLFIRTPEITLNEPLDMIPVKQNISKLCRESEDLKRNISEEKEKSHEIKKLLVRSPGSEDFLTFPISSLSRSMSPDLSPLSITPPPPPQQLPKTKLFANLPKVPLASEEDLRSISPMSSNISLQNLLISFFPMDESADSSDDSDTFIQPARWLSLPSLVVRTMTPMTASINTISLDNILIPPSLTRVVSLPSLQTSECAKIIDITESTETSSSNVDKESKAKVDWASLVDEEDESSCNFYSDSYPPITQTNTQVNVTPSKSPRSRRHHGKKLKNSSSTSLDTLIDNSATPSFSPRFSRRKRRKSPANVFGSSYANYSFNPQDTPTPPRSPGARRHIRNERSSHRDPPSHSQSTSCIPNASSDPWYLQTEFLLPPSVIPSGYCTWVPNPDHQADSRGKEGVVLSLCGSSKLQNVN